MENDEEGVSLTLPLASVARASALQDLDEYRSLMPEEISALEAAGNLATPGWDNVFIHKEGPSLLSHPRRVVRCYFNGRVLMSGDLGGLIEVEPGVPHPQGLYDSTFNDAILGPRILIKGTSLLSSVVVEAGARIVGCGLVACTRLTTFAAGTEIRVGAENAGRPVVVYPEVTMAEVLPQALRKSKAGQGFRQDEYLERMAGYVSRVGSRWSFVCQDARLLHASRVVNAFVGPSALVSDSCVEEATLLSSPSEPTRVTGGSRVTQSVLQWAVHVDGGASVRHCLLMEHSSVEHKAVVEHSVLCPDSGVQLGECHHSLLGPFIGFHHLSLAIALLWPQGRGNVAHGAKIGANHTGRVADQEAVLGEGVFFGLGSVAKFPVDLSESAYSLIAAGTALEPQRLHFPFSLLTESRESGPGLVGLTQIRPAWVLAHSPYTVFRNEEKYAKRSKARRHVLTWKIFRPTTIDLMVTARDRLKAAKEQGQAPYYIQSQIAGLGNNLVTAKSLEEGIRTYTRWIVRYALQGLLACLVRSEPEDEEVWEHQQSLLYREVDATRPLADVLRELVEEEAAIARSVERSKARDDDRGAAIIDDYADTHAPAAADPVVVSAHRRVQAQREEVEAVLAKSAMAHLSLREALAAIPPRAK